ncbi:hypothetical protein JRO89_XS01G0265200 [Xanthoceras sorbifolium]|uniref:Phytocyanin domain-containing protein n=1 Tax=Xanthoceras sorbifolium TaxID=99658 RepID=A0ABQ8ILH1_9ROSI|nr:hypothetical protein JRO89_XS01G0265200 [Xanthoceras sorbifolium]
MALAKKMLAFLLITALFRVSLCAVHKVGDSAGWTTIGNVDYKKWASAKNFHVGDVISNDFILTQSVYIYTAFEYNNQFHNVKQVSHRDFQSCNATSSIAVYSSGSDSMTLKRPGHYYFLCGFPGHCQAGQKVDILVTPASLRSGGVSPSPAPYGSSPQAAASPIIPHPPKSSAPSRSSFKLRSTLVSFGALLVAGFA